MAVTALAAGTPNIAGPWKVHNSIAGHESEQECNFVQTENKLTGSCKGQEKEFQVTGSLDGKKVTWQYESEYNSSPLTMIYTATLDDTSKIAGSVEVQPYGGHRRIHRDSVETGQVIESSKLVWYKDLGFIQDRTNDVGNCQV